MVKVVVVGTGTVGINMGDILNAIDSINQSATDILFVNNDIEICDSTMLPIYNNYDIISIHNDINHKYIPDFSLLKKLACKRGWDKRINKLKLQTNKKKILFPTIRNKLPYKIRDEPVFV